MSLHTTFRVGGPADTYAEPEDEWELRELMDTCESAGTPYLLIGRGSNLLIGDGGFRGTVICLGKAFSKIEVDGDVITAQAGAQLSAVANAALEHGLTGMEFASGIPGSVGGALVMNAGAYGGEMAGVLVRAEGLLPDGTPVSLNREEMHFGYRTSAAAGLGMTVTGATMELRPDDPGAIRERMAELNAKRAEKQPLDVPSAGSTFKRPEGYYAAALIDQCGLKGYSVGGAQVSRKHAGFLVNQGSSSADYLELVRTVQRIVRERAGVELEPEIRFLGWAETAGMPGGGMR